MQTNIKDVLEKQRRLFKSHVTKTIDYRKEALKRLEAAILSHEAEIYSALQKDLGKGEFEAYSTELGGVLKELRGAIKNVDSWTKPKRVSTPIYLMPASSHIHPEPYGVVLIIGPYNYPFSLIMNPLIGAIAAGNTCVLKPSESAGHTAEVIEKIIRESFDVGHAAVIRGNSSNTERLLKERYDYIFFTGGVKVGKIVMKAAAEYLTPVTLELGGKSPAIVTDSSDINIAANRIIWGKFINAGQTCIAPDYVLVHKSVAKEFIDASKRTIHEFYGGNVSKNPEFGRIINQKQFDRLVKLLDESKEALIHGGETTEEDLFISPTLLYPITFEDSVMEEEIFGPILPIIEYGDLEEVSEIVNGREKPLALYLFTKDPAEEKEVLDKISFGGGGINETLLHYVNDNLPFGGVGNSGMGSYHGKYSFDTFSHKKSVMKRPNGFMIDLMNPPYKNKLDLIKKFLK